MFDHLDDPTPWRPDARTREQARRAGRTRRWRHRLGTAGALTALVLFIGVSATSAWARRQLDAVERVEIAGDVLGNGSPQSAPETETILLTSVDTRAGLSAGATDGAPRTDVLVVARLDHEHGTVRVLAIPRDLAVPNTSGSTIRINQVRAEGGPEALIEDVETLLDVQIDHYAELDFEGFTALVDHIGGIDVEVATPTRDTASGLDLAAGCAHLDGAALLALARSRHLEVLGPDGVWLEDTTGDLGRIARQQALAGLLWRAVVELGPSPADVAAMATLAGDHLVVDSGTRDADLVRWADFGMTLDPEDVGQTVLQTAPLRGPNGAAMLQSDQVQRDAARNFLVDTSGSASVEAPSVDLSGTAVVAPTRACGS